MSTVPKKTHRKTILIAEDDEGISSAISQLLENALYVPDPVLDGLRVVVRVRETLSDLILLDVSMPNTDGYDICKELKKDKRVRHIPVIMMSAKNELKKITDKCGADDFIAKPFDILDLLYKIKRNLIVAEQLEVSKGRVLV